MPGPEDGAITRQDRWARLRHSLWQPPRPHGEQPHERVVGPLELFYDLAVVVLIAQAAHRLAGHLAWSGIGQFAVVFTLVWIAWANGSLHYELHGREDARSRITFLVQILVLAVMGACIPAASGARGGAFAVATAVLFAVLAGLWLRAGRGDRPEYRRSSRLYVGGTAAFAVLMACTALLPASARVLAWGLLDAAYLAVFGAVILTASIAAMGAAVVSLVDHAHDSRAPVATAWALCGGAAIVLCATIVVSASLQARHGDPGLHQLLTRSCIPVAAACLGLGALLPAPLLLCAALVFLLGIPWVLAVAHHLAQTSGSPSS